MKQGGLSLQRMLATQLVLGQDVGRRLHLVVLAQAAADSAAAACIDSFHRVLLVSEAELAVVSYCISPALEVLAWSVVHLLQRVQRDFLQGSMVLESVLALVARQVLFEILEVLVVLHLVVVVAVACVHPRHACWISSDGLVLVHGVLDELVLRLTDVEEVLPLMAGCGKAGLGLRHGEQLATVSRLASHR